MILMIVACVAAGSLALVNIKTRPIIEEYKRLEQEKARAQVMKEGVAFELNDPESNLPYFKVYADADKSELIGYIFTARGRGYSSTIETVTGVDTNFNIVGIKITSQQETPGLGAKCQEIRYGEKAPWFQQQYYLDYRQSKDLEPLNALSIAVDKDGGEIHSITGATITGRAISNSIKETAKLLKEKLEVE